MGDHNTPCKIPMADPSDQAFIGPQIESANITLAIDRCWCQKRHSLTEEFYQSIGVMTFLETYFLLWSIDSGADQMDDGVAILCSIFR